MKEHSGVQHELGEGVCVLVNNILTELLQYATNLREVIAVGVEFGFRVLRRRLRNQATDKWCKEYRAHSLFIHMPFPFRSWLGGWIVGDYQLRARNALRSRSALLRRPGRNHAVAARVR